MITPLHPLKHSTLPLDARAELLWPDSPTNQAKWIAAVILVRGTIRGWVADSPTSAGTAALQRSSFGATP